LSAQHLDGSLMMKLGEWAQRIVTFRTGAVDQLADAGWVFKAHMFLGMTIFLVFPFTRLVHVWSGLATVAYLVRPYQVVRSRRMMKPHRCAQSAATPAAAAPTLPDLLLEPGKTA
jgi:nitrate reductase gamma subunit